MERTNIRYVTKEDIKEELDFASIDVSFISLKLILPALRLLMKDDGQVAALIKPQFEAGREKIAFVRADHRQIFRHAEHYHGFPGWTAGVIYGQNRRRLPGYL